VQVSTQNIKGIRLLAIVFGLITGFGVALVVNASIVILSDFVRIPEDIPGIYLAVLIFAAPVVVLGIIVLALRIRKPLSLSDSRTFILSFWGPFFSLYVATTCLYWFVRV
jgi:hypothetical protein